MRCRDSLLGLRNSLFGGGRFPCSAAGNPAAVPAKPLSELEKTGRGRPPMKNIPCSRESPSDAAPATGAVQFADGRADDIRFLWGGDAAADPQSWKPRHGSHSPF